MAFSPLIRPVGHLLPAGEKRKIVPLSSTMQYVVA
jgi:hypothetical protein